MSKGFSLSSVILGYFLVGGGMCASTLVAQYVPSSSELVGYGLLAAGALVGGFLAARASRGSTILEPAIGAVAVVATLVALAAGTPMGQVIWAQAQHETVKFVAMVAGAGVVGALIGAFVGEQLGEATRSSVPWVLYLALATFGASLLSLLIAAVVFAGDNAVSRSGADVGTATMIGVGAGCLLAGLAGGASARTRPLLAALLGGALGVMGFFTLLAKAQPPADKDTLIGLVILAVGGGVVALVGAALGWGVVGRRAEA